MADRFWPFNRRMAYISSLFLVPGCVAVVVWLYSWNGNEETGVPPLALLFAVLVGLLPVLLIVLSSVGSVEAAGVRVAFAAVQEVITDRGTADVLSNLGEPRAVLDSGSDTIIESLKKAVNNDVVQVDLGDGQTWWKTRLFMLAAGARRLGYPRAIVFTCVTPNRPRTFVGWAVPGDIFRSLAWNDFSLRQAAEAAERDTLVWKLSLPQNNPHNPLGLVRELPWKTEGSFYLPAVPHADEFTPERFLLQHLQPLEASMSRGSAEGPIGYLWMNNSRVTDLLDSVLHTEAVDKKEGEKRWVEVILGSTDDFFAVTSNREFVNLVPRRAATNAVLLSVIGRSSR